MRGWTATGISGAALIALSPVTAQAQSGREAELEARLQQLEAAVDALRSELDVTRAEAARIQDQTATADSRIARIELPSAPTSPDAVPPAGFRSGATTINLGGFIKTVASFSRWDDGVAPANSLGRDFYLPSAIPVGASSESTDNDFSAKQTRLWLSLTTTVGERILNGYIETDFQTASGMQGSERTTNGYTPALRRAFLRYDKLTIGQDWTTFQNVAVLPEAVDFVGPTEGTVFVRQPLVRISLPLGPGLTLHASAENPETASANLAAPALIENDDDRMPDFAARLAYSGNWGEASLAGLVRELSVESATSSSHALGWGVSAAGKFLFGGAKQHDLRVMGTYGEGIARYVGLNFAPDVVFDPSTGMIEQPKVFAALASVWISISPHWRMNIMGGYQDVAYAGKLPAADLQGFNAEAWSLAGNIFYTPLRGLDFGVEYRRGNRRLLSGASGQLDRIEFAAKYSF